MSYYIRYYCPDCFNYDIQGCFNGGYEVDTYDDGKILEFDTLLEAHIYCENNITTSSCLEYEIVDNTTGEIQYSSE
jgi:hypothetical protein